MKKQRSESNVLWWSTGALVFFSAALFTLPLVLEKSYSAEGNETSTSTASTVESEPAFIVTHVATPEPMKAIYMTACVAATPSWRQNLKEFVEKTEINSIMIDVKDYTGTISFNTDANCYVRDLKEFIGELHESNIYVIARLTVFQDPSYALLHPELAVKSKATGGVWKDRKGLAFIDVGAKPYWDYIIDLAKKSYEMGFDEINFDYIRYPSDGDMKDAHYAWTVGTSTKAEMLEAFFSYLHGQMLGVGAKTSADLFGLVTLAQDDLGIGQELERALPYFDYIYPMVYPSHFAHNTGGFGDPATHPYEIIKYSMGTGYAREQAWNAANGLSSTTPSKLRPWIQDFDLGAQYNAPEVRAQMQATYDIGLTGWLSWDASNKYTRDAYLIESAAGSSI